MSAAGPGSFPAVRAVQTVREGGQQMLAARPQSGQSRPRVPADPSPVLETLVRLVVCSLGRPSLGTLVGLEGRSLGWGDALKAHPKSVIPSCAS